MDLSPIVNQFIGQYIGVLAWLLPALAVIGIVKSPRKPIENENVFIAAHLSTPVSLPGTIF